MEKQYVRSLFDSIANRYDLLNHLLSGGIDYYWRRKAVEHLADIQPKTILDVATGTGDFAIATLRLNPEKVIGIDIAGEMLKIGRNKVAKRGVGGIISLQSGEAENIQFPDKSFDAAIVAFGARNFEHLERGLGEMHRVIRQGGKIVVLEFSRPRIFPFKQLYFFYFKTILPYIGKFVSNHQEAYTYLPDTVMKFPDGDEFLDVLQKIGFTKISEERLTSGIATVYVGSRT